MRHVPRSIGFFFFNDTATTEIYTLSLHDALPILRVRRSPPDHAAGGHRWRAGRLAGQHATRSADPGEALQAAAGDRKSTRLNSSHSQISYAVFCLKKKKQAAVDTGLLATVVPENV